MLMRLRLRAGKMTRFLLRLRNRSLGLHSAKFKFLYIDAAPVRLQQEK
jgi:hypothetical protein